MTVNGWQERLAEYFSGLRAELNKAGNHRPIFALEHNLSKDEWDDLVTGLRDHTNFSGPATRHYFVWSVYAAEIGYRFQGDEYWQTFAEKLPGWSRQGDRDFIKDAFYSFQKRFHGAVPSGSWAKNFTIICWPITHAVLPKDLQRHLAGILYDVRGAFTPDLLNNTAALGNLIAANSEGTSSRFQKFVEERELVGRISAALLSSDTETAGQLLAPNTLKRITSDLQAEQSAREWLSAARQRASSVKLTGFKSRSLMPGVALSEVQSKELIASEGEYREQLELTIKQTGEDTWALNAHLPNLSHLAPSNATFQRAFASQRSFIASSDRTHFAPRFFSFNRQDVPLMRWPVPNSSILRFEPSPPGLAELLDSCCSLPRITTALFRLREDGSGTYVRSNLLKPGYRYVLVTTESLPSLTLPHGSTKVEIACEGVVAFLIDVPEFVSDFYFEAAKSLGLGLSIGIEVNPAGYPPSSWNGDGDVVWHVGSPKVLAVTTSIEAQEIALNLLGNGADQVIQARIDGRGPVFIDVSDLTIGTYQLHVIAQVAAAQAGFVTGNVGIEIIPENDSVLGAGSAQGFTVLATPTLPTFEELWGDCAQINIYGPKGAQIRAQLAFYSDSAGLTNPFFVFPLGKLSLPFEEAHWESTLSRAKRDKNAHAAQEDAASCRLQFRSIDLGESALHCEREFVPFRWAVRTKSNHHKLRLVQNDSTSSVLTLRANFDFPGKFTAFALSPKLEFEEGGTGGLFVARSNSSFAALVLNAPALNSLAALKLIEARMPAVHDIHSLVSLCDALRLWTEAELLGDPLSRMKRDAVVRILRTALLESICGAQWVSAETALEHGRQSLASLSAMISKANDYKFQRLLSDAIHYANSLTDEETALVALDLAMSGNLLRPNLDTDDTSHLAAVRAFINLFKTKDSTSENLPLVDASVAGIALGEGQLFRIVRLLLLAARQIPVQTVGLGDRS
jgi:hypothetical protein